MGTDFDAVDDPETALAVDFEVSGVAIALADGVVCLSRVRRSLIRSKKDDEVEGRGDLLVSSCVFFSMSPMMFSEDRRRKCRYL